MKCNLLHFALALAIAGCGTKGPAITDCTPNPAKTNFKCFNQANGVESFVLPQKVDNWIFVSAADERSIQTACANSTGWPKVNVCSFDAKQMHYICFNEVDGKTSKVLFVDSEKSGFIGVSPVDEQILLEFCEARAQAKKAKS